jgi:CubicO group peptidase (beta-lactamase class C family)
MPPTRAYDLRDWLTAPHHRHAFQRIREIIPTALIRRDGGEVLDLPVSPAPLDDLDVPALGRGSTSLATHLDETCADAICVVHHGRIVYERYLNGMTPRTPHLMMSVSKSVCGAALGVAIGRGLLAIDDLVTEIAPELAGTSLDGATVRHVIDMTAGTLFHEDYDDYEDSELDTPLLEYERQAGYRPLGARTPIGSLGHFRTYPLERPHGAWFSYRSPLTNIAARLLEVVHDVRYADIVSRDVWSPLGMEHDADIMLDPLGQAIVEGGMSCTVRDLARFGLAYLGDGDVDRRDVLPTAWVDDTRCGDDAARAAFAANPEQSDPGPWTMYRNAFWVHDAELLSGIGIFGQWCWVDRRRQVVIARFSTYPTALPEDHTAATVGAFEAIAEQLAPSVSD